MAKVYVIIYNDPDDGYVGVDVFDAFDKALEQFDHVLTATQEAHEDDQGWIVELNRTPQRRELYFRTEENYEVFLRVESIL